MKTKALLKELKIDEKLTTIRHINPVFVSRYRQAYRNGCNLPPLIVEKDTYRIISGNHRYSALIQEYSENTEISVEPREYKSEGEVLEDFAHENATHGNPLDHYTKRKLIREMLNTGISLEEISKILGVSQYKIEKMGEGVVRVKIGNRTEERPMKTGFEPAKEPLTEKQWKEHDKKDRGLTVVQQVSQLNRWLKEGHVSHSEANLRALSNLKAEIDKYLKVNVKV